MRAVGFVEYGTPVSTLRVPEPRPGAGEVLVRVVATAVNPADVQFRRGDHDAFIAERAGWPRFGGLEFVGVVEAVGDDVAVWRGGETVVGTAHFIPTGRGSHAQLVAVPQEQVVALPEGIAPEMAAGVPMNALTARAVMDAAEGSPGPLVVTGAAGAVGGFVVELAAAGREVVAVSDAADEGWLRERGAQHVVPRGPGWVERTREVLPAGAGVLVDAARIGAEAMGVLRDGGHFLALRPGWSPDPERGIAVDLVSFRRLQRRPDVLETLLGDAAKGRLTPRLAAVVDADEGEEAFRLAASAGLRGRVVLSFASAGSR